jgi:hypothetical protein
VVDSESGLILVGTDEFEAFFKEFDLFRGEVLKVDFNDHDVVKLDCDFAVHLDRPKELVVDALDEGVSFVEL